jgi:guanosine-3',5'-bis(diphosphate) 3'-pyrophosphohydrolase
MNSGDLRLLLKAVSFAAQRHRHQRRKDAKASPYINHPIDLASVLAEEGGVTDLEVLCAALLHDTLEDTDTRPEELRHEFGERICQFVEEVSDDKSLPSRERKRLQVEHAAHVSPQAAMVKLADKICNLRDMVEHPPAGWSLTRRQAYFDWARQVIDNLRDPHPRLLALFDEAYGRRPQQRNDG